MIIGRFATPKGRFTGCILQHLPFQRSDSRRETTGGSKADVSGKDTESDRQACGEPSAHAPYPPRHEPEKLGEALNLTFQQVQKYEKGTNRIGASRLQQISKSLNIPPAYFFDGAPAFDNVAGADVAHSAAAEAGSAYVVDFLSTTEGLLLNRAFARIQNSKVRKRIVDLVTALAETDDGLPPPSDG